MADVVLINSKVASDYDKKFGKTLDQLEQEIQGNLDFIGIKGKGRLLDYACGTGLLSKVSLRCQI